MMSFKEYLKETKGYPNWVKITVVGLIMRIRSLENQIQSETDNIKQNKLISKQNSLISYINGLGIAIDVNDKTLMSRMRSGMKRI